MQCGLDVRNRNGIASDCLVVRRKKSVGIFGFPMTFLWSCRPERRDGRFRFTARQVGSEATAGRQWPRISSKPPQPQTKPGPHTINFTDQGPPKGERTMIETPVLLMVGVLAIGAAVWRLYS
jgi:hypothetical protein